MKEIKLLRNMEDGCSYDNELGAYKVVKSGLDDIVILRNYKYKELKQVEIFTFDNSCEEYRVVEVENYDTHIVKPLENLNSIAEKYCTSVDELKKINNLKTDKLFIGQILKI